MQLKAILQITRTQGGHTSLTYAPKLTPTIAILPNKACRTSLMGKLMSRSWTMWALSLLGQSTKFVGNAALGGASYCLLLNLWSSDVMFSSATTSSQRRDDEGAAMRLKGGSERPSQSLDGAAELRAKHVCSV